jgi:hypothetical protein
MTAAERLNVALITTASQGLRPHCSDSGTGDLWISEHSGNTNASEYGADVMSQSGLARQQHDP